MSTALSTKITWDDLQKMPEDNRRREVIDGELIVSPSPTDRHQDIVGRLFRVIADYLDHARLGRVFIAPLDTILEHEQVLQPDVLYISKARAAIVDRWVYGAPDLAVEILSESTRRRDEVRKRQLYEQFGVSEYWIVDPEADHVIVYRLADGRYGEGLAIRETLTTPLLPGLEIDLARLFAAQ